LLPLYRQKKPLYWLIPEDQTFSYLKERKTAVYNNLKDLDFDYSIGKIAEQDYLRIRSEFKQEAAQILTQMDELDHWVEKELTEREIHSPKIICSSCNGILPQDAKYCPQCGVKI
jgi:ribosomal protein L40E